MKVVAYGSGVAPSITHDGTHWRLAIGQRPGVEVLTLNAAGVIVASILFPDGYGFPSVDGAHVLYKANETQDWRATLDGRYRYAPAGGNWPVVAGFGWAVWQDVNYDLWRVPVASPTDAPLHLGTGAPDGLAWVDADGSVALIKDVRTLIPGMLNPQGDGDVWVGEQPDSAPQYPLGMAVIANDRTGWIDGGVCNTPHIATDGEGNYAICTWGDAGVRVWFATLAELQALPSAPQTPEPEPQPPDPEPNPPDPQPEPPDPEPEPEPPIPPIPEPPMPDSQRVLLAGAGGNYLMVDPASAGQGPFGGLTLTYTADHTHPHAVFLLSKPDALYALVPESAPGWYLGADATKHSADLTRQYYTVVHRQGYESWAVGRWPDGHVSAIIHFTNTDTPSQSFDGAGLVVIPL